MSLQRKAGRPAFITVSRFPQLLLVFPLALFLYLPTFLTTSQSSPVAFLKHESPFLQCHFILTPHFSSSLLPSFLHPTRFFLSFAFLSFLILLCPYLLFYPSSVYFNSFQSFFFHVFLLFFSPFCLFTLSTLMKFYPSLSSSFSSFLSLPSLLYPLFFLILLSSFSCVCPFISVLFYPFFFLVFSSLFVLFYTLFYSSVIFYIFLSSFC